MIRKTYTTPEVDIEKFIIKSQIFTLSDDEGLEGSGSEFTGGDDWDF